MKRNLIAFCTLCILGLTALGTALAGTLTLVVAGKSQTIDGFLEKNIAWVSLVPFMQALGDNVRPVKIDILSSTIVLTKTDGKVQVSVSMQRKESSVYVDALAAARGLGYVAALDGTTVRVNANDPQATSGSNALYPKSLDSALLEKAVKTLYDSLDSGNADAALEAVLNGSGIPVFGTPSRPADMDLLNAYQVMRRSFALSLEIFSLQMGYKYRMFTKLEDYLTGLKERGLASLDINRLQTGIATAFNNPKASRSQAVVALVAAMGRERVRRGVTLSLKRQVFWGDDALDPIQLRLLDTVLTNAFAVGAIRPKNLSTPMQPLSSRATSQTRVLTKADVTAPKSIQDFFNWVAEKAVDQIVKETYPGVKDTMDHEIADLAGVPLPSPINEEMYKGMLEGDFGKVKLAFGNLRTELIKQAIKEGAQVILCGSLILYGYQASMKLERDEVNHFTVNNAEGAYSSKIKLRVEFTDDYHKNIFDQKVITIAGFNFTPPPIENGAILKKLGCDLPEKGAAKEKPVEWELDPVLVPHAEGGKIIVFPNSLKTNAAGEAEARFDAIRENVPKAFRVGKYKSAVNGGITVTIKDLLPSNWWRIQAAVQYGQTEDKAGTNFKRLRVSYFTFPNLKLEFFSDLHFIGKTPYGTGHFNAQLVSSVPLTVLPEGDDLQKSFIAYRGADRLRYEQYHLDATSDSCTPRISRVLSGQLEVIAGTRDFESTMLTVGVNSFVQPPIEIVECEKTQAANTWFGLFTTLHQDLIGQVKLPKTEESIPSFVLQNPKETDALQTLWKKSFQQKGIQLADGATVDEDTTVRLMIQP
jgi:hypothetical protein